MRFFVLSVCVAHLAGCASLHVDDHRFGDSPSPVGVEPDGGVSVPDATPPGDAPPEVMLTSPKGGNAVADEPLTIRGIARDDHGIASVFVKVGPNVARLAQSDDGFATFSITTAVPQGTFDVEAYAFDTSGQKSAIDRITLVAPTKSSDNGAPTVTVTSPADGSAPLHSLVLVQGTASDDRGVVGMDVYRNGELLTERPVETDDFFAHWARLVPLTPGLDNVLRFVARDAGGREGETTITLFGRADVDRDPPELAVTTPPDGDTVQTDRLEVRGTANDNIGVREVKVRVGSVPPGASAVAYGPYVRADTTDGFATWSASLEVPVGRFTLEVRAIDLNGLGTTLELSLENAFVPTYAAEVEIPLRLRDVTAPTLRFELDEQGVNDIISEDIQRDIVLLELETTELLTNAVNRIKESCGTAWRADNPDPGHDCSLTPLGRTYGQAQGVPWQQSAEYSLVRILTMTPRNAVVAGTSIAELEGIANSLDVGGGFNQILAETLGIGITQEVVSTASVVRALQNYWMASHPEVRPGARLPITLYDGMNDLAPLRERFGPKGGHPGLLDPAFTPHSKVFDDSFKLVLGAQSNLRWMDGVDLSDARAKPAKDYIALIHDTTGPNYDDVLEFDFTDPKKFDVQGLVSAPKVDLRMTLEENPNWVNSCLPSRGGESACKNNLPTSPLAGYMWSIPRWQVETLIGGAAYEQYRTRSNYYREYRWLLGIIQAAEVTVGRDGNPPGWATFKTFLGIGNPPQPQYLWELILEVGQRALHNFSGISLPEGRANVVFTLEDIDVGLTASEIREAMRPELQKQRHTLSDRLLGDYRRNNGAVDFYYRRGADGLPYVFFVAESDPLPHDRYDYQKPGFFADPELTNKLSTKAPGTSGDSEHEKLRLLPGETTVYAQDDGGNVFRLRFVVGDDADEIRVFVARKVR